MQILFFSIAYTSSKDGSANLKYVFGVADHSEKILNYHKVVVNKSAVSVGKADKLRTAIEKFTKASLTA